MNDVELLLSLLGVVAAVVWLARKTPIPYPVFLVAAGAGIALVPGLPDVELEPDVILLVFLPPLVHAAAWSSSTRHLREHRSTLALLAAVLVAATAFAVAAVLHAIVPGLSWAPAIALGAAVSCTDTVAATSTFRRLGVPERVTSLVEGESLLNDGTSLALYGTAISATVAGSFTFAHGVADLLLVGSGGAAIGWVVGWLSRQARLRVDDALLEVTLTLLTPYLAFVPAEELGLSGILAAVASGLYLGARQGRDFTPAVRMQAYGFWNQLTFLLESVLFILIGLLAPGIVEAIDDEPLGQTLGAAAAAAGVVIALRLAVTLVGVRVLALRERVVAGWAGMRGAVSLAAALAIPLTVDSGAPFPAREELLFVCMFVIASTLLLQGLTLPLLVRRLGVEEHAGKGARRRALTRFETVQAALARIGELSFGDDVPADLVDRARDMYTERAQQLTGECREGAPSSPRSDVAAWTRLRRELLEAERAMLLELRDEGRVPLSVIREIEQDLDLEAARLERVAPSPVEVP